MPPSCASIQVCVYKQLDCTSFLTRVYPYTSIPRNLNRLIDIKQTITLTGLGTDAFDAAVHGIQTIHQVFHNHVTRGGSRLRDWVPGRDGQDLTLTFTNRYLTSPRDVGGEASVDLSQVVDPFNILRPLIKGETHTTDNVMEYWERKASA